MCWDNFIGIDSVCTPQSESGFSFADIGISKSDLDSYIGDEFSTGQELAQNKVNFAASAVQSVINTTFGSKYKTTSLVNSALIGLYQDNLVVEASIANTLKGIQLECADRSSYLNLNITAISLQVAFTGTVDVLVYDLVQNKLLDTIQVDAVDGEISRLTLNKNYATNKQKLNLFIGYESSFASYRSIISARGCAACTNNYWGFSSKYVRNSGGTIPIASAKVDGNVASTNDTGGVSIEYGVSCDFSNWLCSVKHSVALPIMYKAAELIMDYALQQKQWNSNTGVKRDDLKARQQRYKDEYETHMGGLWGSMSPPSDSTCFHCSGPVRTVVTLP